MAAVRLTKNELRKEKDSLKRYERYLPTLHLKKQQLQMVMRQIEEESKALDIEKKALVEGAGRWIGVFAREEGIADLLAVGRIITSVENIAGLDIPVFHELVFSEELPDLFLSELWVDAGLDLLKKVLVLDARARVLERRHQLIHHELRITSQRVNLFEKIKIPEARDNIRKIQIYLGDQQTAAVVRGKISKKKLPGAKAS